jgi:hypothetical protein
VVDLPTYLAEPYNPLIQEPKHIDDEILREVVEKTGFNPEEVAHAVMERQRNHLSVAYYLIMDARQRKLKRKVSTRNDWIKTIAVIDSLFHFDFSIL